MKSATVSPFQAGRQTPMRKAVRARLEIGIGDFLPFKRDEYALRMIVDGIFDRVGQRIRGLRVELADGDR